MAKSRRPKRRRAGAESRSGRAGSKPPAKSKVLIVDDHPVVRQGLMQLINREDDLEVCGAAESGPDALRQLAACAPNVAVVDASLGTGNGLDLVKDMRIRHPGVPVLVLSMHDEMVYAERFLRAGARGYVMKEVASEMVLTAIRKVLAGDIYLSERMAARLLHKLVDGAPPDGGSFIDTLSDRELEVFRMIGRGLATRQIADRLHLSVKTVEAHRAHIKVKLRLDNGSKLLQQAIQWVQAEQGLPNPLAP